MNNTDHKSSDTPRLNGLIADNPDLVDRIFAYLIEIVPAIAQDKEHLEQAKAAVRDEFGGCEAWVRSPRTEKSRAMADQVLSMFNGRNATEVARALNIGRATVYRCIKTPGR